MESIDTYEPSDGCSYSIAPGWGCNLFSWRVNGQELMYCPVDYPAAATKITGGGTPILFPSIGRTWDQSSGVPVLGNYRIHGHDKTYYMPPHGIVFLSKFRKVDESREPGKAVVVYELSVPEDVKSSNFPFDLELTQRFTMLAGSVEIESVITNNGPSPAPCAFGYHPYFQISNSRREGIEARLPVSRQLFLTSDTVLPTGESEASDGIVTLPPSSESCTMYDEINGRRMSLIDRGAGRSVHIDFDEKFEELVVWAPDGADFLCLEPWTRGLGAFERLREPDWSDGKHIPIIAPGEVKSYKARFSVEKLV